MTDKQIVRAALLHEVEDSEIHGCRSAKERRSTHPARKLHRFPAAIGDPTGRPWLRVAAP